MKRLFAFFTVLILLTAYRGLGASSCLQSNYLINFEGGTHAQGATWVTLSNSFFSFPNNLEIGLQQSPSIGCFFQTNYSRQLMGSLNICTGGTTIASGTKGMFLPITNNTGYIALYPPTQSKYITMGFWFLTTLNPSDLHVFDWMFLQGVGGAQFNNCKYVNGVFELEEIDGPGAPSIYGNSMTIQSNTWYWVSMLYVATNIPNATYGSNHQILVYDTQTNLLNTIKPTGAVPENVDFWRLIVGASSSTYSTTDGMYIDSLRIDYSPQPEWPLLPYGSGSPAQTNSTYYVATTGNDSTGTGAIGSPWATLGHATGLMIGGDTLYVRGGTYTGEFQLTGPSGSNASLQTVIQNYPGEVPVFDNGNSSSGNNRLTQMSWVTISGLTLTNINQGLFLLSCSNIVVTNMTIAWNGQEGLTATVGSRDITIVSNVIHDVGVSGDFGEGIYIGSGDNVMDNTHNCTIRGNTIYNAGCEGIEIKQGTYSNTVEGNILYSNNITGQTHGLGAGALEFDGQQTVNYWTNTPNHIARGNLIYASHIGLRAVTGGWYYNNVIYGCDTNGLQIDEIGDHEVGSNYVRYVYNNTVATTTGIVSNSGPAVILNNLGWNGTYNLLSSSGYYVNAGANNYHLAIGSAPVRAGTNLISVVATDFDGNARSAGTFDLGAYLGTPGTLKVMGAARLGVGTY